MIPGCDDLITGKQTVENLDHAPVANADANNFTDVFSFAALHEHEAGGIAGNEAVDRTDDGLARFGDFDSHLPEHASAQHPIGITYFHNDAACPSLTVEFHPQVANRS